MQQLGWPAERAARCQCAHLAAAGCTRHLKLHACSAVDAADVGLAGGQLPGVLRHCLAAMKVNLFETCICDAQAATHVHLLHADAAARSKPDPGKLPTYDPADMVYEPDMEQIPAYEPPTQVSSASSMPLSMSGHAGAPSALWKPSGP